MIGTVEDMSSHRCALPSCGKPLTRTRQTYCDIDCYRESRKQSAIPIRVCEWCGISYRPQNRYGRFCSPRCGYAGRNKVSSDRSRNLGEVVIEEEVYQLVQDGPLWAAAKPGKMWSLWLLPHDAEPGHVARCFWGPLHGAEMVYAGDGVVPEFR